MEDNYVVRWFYLFFIRFCDAMMMIMKEKEQWCRNDNNWWKKTLETVREREREGEREREQRNETKAKASWSSSEREKFRVPKKKRKEIWGGLLPFLWLSLSVPLFFFFLSFFLFWNERENAVMVWVYCCWLLCTCGGWGGVLWMCCFNVCVWERHCLSICTMQLWLRNNQKDIIFFFFLIFFYFQ